MNQPTTRGAYAFACALLLTVGIAQATQAENWVIGMGRDQRFHPDKLAISPGDTVIWLNKDDAPHTITSGRAACLPDGLWTSGMVLPTGTYSRVFNEVGEFGYFCEYSCGAGMRASITVVGPTASWEQSWGEIKRIYR